MIFKNTDIKKLLSVETKGSVLIFNFNTGEKIEQDVKDRRKRIKKVFHLVSKYNILTGKELEVYHGK